MSARVDHALSILEARAKGKPNAFGFEDPAGIVRAELEDLREKLRASVGAMRDVEALNIPARLHALDGTT